MTIWRVLAIAIMAGQGAGAAAAEGPVVDNGWKADGRREYVILSGHARAPADVAFVAQHWQGEEPLESLDPAAAGGADPAALQVIYYSGAARRGAGGIVLRDGDGSAEWDLDPHLAGRVPRRVILLNLCASGSAVSAADFTQEGDWLVAFPADGADCRPEDFARMALDAISGPAQGWEDALRRAGLGVAASAAVPAGADAAALHPVANDDIVITALGPVDVGPMLSARPEEPRPIAARPADLPAARGAEAEPDRSVQPLRPGLPQPSVILGEQAAPRLQVDSGPLGVPAAQRDRLRNEDPAGFARLLAQGGLDPDESRLAAAIQSELARMGCYGAAVDGLWGAGSEAGLRRYFAQAGDEPVTTAPAVALYRQIIARPDVACPPARVTQPAPQPVAGTEQGTGQGTGRGQGAARGPGRQQPPRQEPGAAQSAPTRPQISNSISGAGMFR